MRTLRKDIVISESSQAQFRNLTDFCVGTGRIDLAMQQEYQQQLRAVQEACHFRYIRGHGLFSDQMGICQVHKDAEGNRHTEYCFTYLDRTVDAWRACGLRPFLELGFMPAALTDSPNTLFYWNAHTAPPRNMNEWTALVKATLQHLKHRYGEEEVTGWPCEIWNEPNLTGFWENADKPKYLELYRATVLAVKEVLPGMKVGGPAICGGTGSQEWISDFLVFCRDGKVPVDFVTRHAYLGQTPERRGRYLYQQMAPVSELISEMRRSREIIDSFPEYRGMPMYITEFNTSYNPFCPIHDTNLNAVICASLLSSLGDVSDGYSYWTFGDVFEEQGIPPRCFHGGFGLMANGLIPKPTMWAFSFFTGLKGECVYRDDCAVLVRRPDGGYEGVLWNLCEDGEKELAITLTVPAEREAAVLMERVDERTCNPLRAWHVMGEPEDLNSEQLAFLRAAGQPSAEILKAEVQDGTVTVRLTLAKNALVRLRILPAERCDGAGYDYSYYCEE